MQIICMGFAPILCAASIIFGSTSRRLLSTSLATNGNAATTSGTIVAVVPTVVPISARDRGNTIIISIKNGMDLRRFIMTLSIDSTGFGKGKYAAFFTGYKQNAERKPD